MVEISHSPGTALDDPVVDAIHAIEIAVEREAGVPERLVPPRALVAAEMQNPPDFTRIDVWTALEGSQVVGWSHLRWNDVPDNRELVNVGVSVHPDARRRGIGRRLLATTLETAIGLQCRLVDIEARTTGPAVPFLDTMRLEPRLHAPRNICATSDLDRALLEKWVTCAAERAGDYDIVAWDGPCPADFIDEFVDLWHVMNSAPMEELEYEAETMTPARHRAMERAWDAQGHTVWTVAARHRPTDVLAGFTVLLLRRHWPEVVEQWDTGVRVEHRNRGIGRWLKALNALRLLDERPEVQAIETWNAGSNRPMLAINEAMGFQALEVWAEWQGDIVEVAGRATRA